MKSFTLLLGIFCMQTQSFWTEAKRTRRGLQEQGGSDSKNKAILLLLDTISQEIAEDPLFVEFVAKFGKKYSSPEELVFRFRVFQNNLKVVQSSTTFQDAKGNSRPGLSVAKSPQPFNMGINHFSDMSDEEFAKFYLIPEEVQKKKKKSESQIETPEPAIFPQNSNSFRPIIIQNPNIFQAVPQNSNIFQTISSSNSNIFKPITSPEEPSKQIFQNPNSSQPISSSPNQNAKKTLGNSEEQKSTPFSRRVTFNLRRLQSRVETGLPASINWAKKGVISKVKNQNNCSSCYAFATTAALESYAKLKGLGDLSLSEQEIIDCDSESEGCGGGQPAWALDYIAANGISSDKHYPYKGNASRCQLQTNRKLQEEAKVKTKGRSFRVLQTIQPFNGFGGDSPFGVSSGFGGVSPFGSVFSDQQKKDSIFPSMNGLSAFSTHPAFSSGIFSAFINPPTEALPNSPKESAISSTRPDFLAASRERFKALAGFSTLRPGILNLLNSLAKGPVVIAQHVTPAFRFFASGVYTGQDCVPGRIPNHAVLAVGYDLKAPVPYILIKNSWGADWGESGFYRIAIGELSNSNKGVCSIAGEEFSVVPKLRNK